MEDLNNPESEIYKKNLEKQKSYIKYQNGFNKKK